MWLAKEVVPEDAKQHVFLAFQTTAARAQPSAWTSESAQGGVDASCPAASPAPERCALFCRCCCCRRPERAGSQKAAVERSGIYKNHIESGAQPGSMSNITKVSHVTTRWTSLSGPLVPQWARHYSSTKISSLRGRSSTHSFMAFAVCDVCNWALLEYPVLYRKNPHKP